jgi:hypothetical protein
MNATKMMNHVNRVAGRILLGVIALSLPLAASAEQGLDASSQTKVNNAKAKGWSQTDGKKDGYQQRNEKTLVNIGSKRAGNCTVNVGTAKPGEKAPKDIVVTTKDVINICK